MISAYMQRFQGGAWALTASEAGTPRASRKTLGPGAI